MNLYPYGQTLKMCKLFREADSYFKGKDVNTNEINKNTKVKGYCSSDGCKTNEDRINALTVYIYMEFKNSIRATDYNKYDECFLMWISDKLFNMYHESKGDNKKKGFVYLITLNQAYEKYLEKYKAKLDYWVLLNMQKGLKEANLKYMSEFYKLLNNICKTIVDYKDNGAESKKLSRYSKNCLNQYRILYMNISECQSYLDLLNKLKGIYDDFRSHAIKKNSSNNDLKTKLIKLTPKDEKEMKAVRGFKTYNFNDPKCKFPIKKKTTTPKALKPNPGPASNTKIQRESPGSQGVSNSTGGQLSNKEDTSKGSGSGSQGSNGEKTDTDNDPPDKGGPEDDQGDSLDGSGSGQGDKGGPIGGSSGDKGSQGGSDTDPGTSGSQSTSWLSFDIGSSIFEIVSKGMEQLNNALDFVEQKREQLTKVTDTIKDFYSTSVSNIKTAYDNSRNFLNSIIVHISSQSEKVNISDKSGDNKLGSGGTGDGLPTPNGSPPSQKDSPQTPSGTPHSSLPSENPKEQTNPSQLPHGPSGNQNSDQTDQEGTKKTIPAPVVKQENSGTETKGNEITKIGDIYVLKEYKQIGISIIVLLIPITLVIMHKVNKENYEIYVF
ncbi:hypothetical protein YYE_04922 [Plasmodium vinckei vinckei]|uniref:PIR protein CIR protein n=1 Tax=Plasmodium vinckei vinckei TaxID=54757 RepID=A0A081I975_PLAVN|nr:hypothetical protein YYE_04922 [Plasmodium vinckei vinckei]